MQTPYNGSAAMKAGLVIAGALVGGLVSGVITEIAVEKLS